MTKPKIEFREMTEYEKLHVMTLFKLEEIQAELEEIMTNLCLSGDMKEWSDSQPIGTVINFGYENLFLSEDTNVKALFNLKEEIEATLEKIDNPLLRAMHKSKHKDEMMPYS